MSLNQGSQYRQIGIYSSNEQYVHHKENKQFDWFLYDRKISRSLFRDGGYYKSMDWFPYDRDLRQALIQLSNP